MKVLLIQVAGKLPNIALMRIAEHHRVLGHEVRLVRRPNECAGIYPNLIYASVIFTRNAELIQKFYEVLNPHGGGDFGAAEKEGEMRFNVYGGMAHAMGNAPRPKDEANVVLFTGCRSMGPLCPRCYYGKHEEVRMRVEIVGNAAVSTCPCGYSAVDS